MKIYAFRVQGTFAVPDDAEEVLANDGAVVGLTLPGSATVKLWASFELQDGDGKDLSGSEREALGITALNYDEHSLEEVPEGDRVS